MNNRNIIIGSLAMDLKRVALGLHNGSLVTVSRFKAEAFKRIEDLEREPVDDYTKRLVGEAKKALKGDEERVSEDALMYSTLFQNLALRSF
jgi:hypothetical protein